MTYVERKKKTCAQWNAERKAELRKNWRVVPASQKSERRKKIEARWALRKRESAMRGAA